MKIGCVETTFERRAELVSLFQAACCSRGLCPPMEVASFSPGTEDELNFESIPEVCVIGAGFSPDKAAWICCTLRKCFGKVKSRSAAEALAGKRLSIFVIASKQGGGTPLGFERYADRAFSAEDAPNEIALQIIELAKEQNRQQMNSLVPLLLPRYQRLAAGNLPAVQPQSRGIERRSETFPLGEIKQTSPKTADLKQQQGKRAPRILPGDWMRGSDIHFGSGGLKTIARSCSRTFQQVVDSFKVAFLNDQQNKLIQQIRVDGREEFEGWYPVKARPDQTSSRPSYWDGGRFASAQSDVWTKFSH